MLNENERNSRAARFLGDGHPGVLGAGHQTAHDEFVEGKARHRLTLTRDELRSMEWNPDEPIHPSYKSPSVEDDDEDSKVGGIGVGAGAGVDPSFDSAIQSLSKSSFNPKADLATEDAAEYTGGLIPNIGGVTASCKYCKAGTCYNKNHNKVTGQGQLPGFDMSGRGGGGRPPGHRGGLKGATWDHDETLKLEVKPSELYPPHPNLKKPAPPTERQKKQVKYYKEVQEEVHRGPLYTKPTKRDPNAPAQTFSEDQYNRQFGTNTKADVDPFTGVETYSMKYAPKKNVLPKLPDRPFDKSLFPEELWSTLEGKDGQEVRAHINRSMEKKARFMDDEPEPEPKSKSKSKNPSDKTASLLEKIDKAAGDGDDEEKEDNGEEEREVDDAFSDASGDDYNAEAYFDDGEGGDDADDAGGDDY